MLNQKNISDDLDQIEAYVVRLNIDSPIDRWWRKKHNVAFNSAEHRAISIVDQYAERYEDYLYDNAHKTLKKRRDDPYIYGENDFVYHREASEEDNLMSDDEFDSISLDD